MRLIITLPRDRRRSGDLFLVDDAGDVIFTAPCRGKADNQRAAQEGNPTRDPTQPYGDTPSGDYAPTRVVRFAEAHPRLGDAWIPLEGGSGDALQARINGRTGLGVHAGRGNGELVATYGCVRMRDRDFARLAELIGDRAVEPQVVDTD